MLRGVATAAPIIIAEGETGAVQGLLVCPVCQKVCKNKVGLTIHMKRIHGEAQHRDTQCVGQRSWPSIWYHMGVLLCGHLKEKNEFIRRPPKTQCLTRCDCEPLVRWPIELTGQALVPLVRNSFNVFWFAWCGSPMLSSSGKYWSLYVTGSGKNRLLKKK